MLGGFLAQGQAGIWREESRKKLGCVWAGTPRREVGGSCVPASSLPPPSPARAQLPYTQGGAAYPHVNQSAASSALASLWSKHLSLLAVRKDVRPFPESLPVSVTHAHAFAKQSGGFRGGGRK